jgi:TatD DNase family protein
MILTDTHTHLYSAEFDNDRVEMINRAMAAGINRMFMPNIDKSSVDKMLSIRDEYPESCFPMMGLHPCSVKEDYMDQIGEVANWLAKETFYAIGEIGIDLYWDKSTQQIQENAFRMQLEFSVEYNLPVVIHTRDAFNEAYQIISEMKAIHPSIRGVFHCFSGTAEQAQKAIDLGFYLGIGGVVTFKNSGLDKVVEKIDLKHIVLETDSPYLSPDPYRGKRNESCYLIKAAEKIAEIKGISLEEVAAITTQNSMDIFAV